MARVSVVMPVFNAAGSVGRALASLQAQSVDALEIVVVDDGSTDGSREIIAAQAADDPRVRILGWPDNRGVVAAMNYAVDASSGEFVARMDADDDAYPERLARQARLLVEQPDIAVCASAIRIVGGAGGYDRFETWVNGLVTHEAMARERFVETPVVNPSAMFRRAAWDAVGGVRELSWAEDYDLWLRLFAAGFRFAKVPECLLDWHDSPGRLTRRDGRYSQRSFLEAKAHHVARLPGVAARGLQICGAGPIGKRFARAIQRAEVTIDCFYEVNRRRIGEVIAGAPVRAQEALDPAGATVLIGAVGRPGARPLLRALAAGQGYVEGEDFWLVA